ncbi:MAG: aminomethyl-transferring glycine dehydrogenase subunit GcvPB [bacterium]
MTEKLIFEISKKGRSAYNLPEIDVPFEETEKILPENLIRKGNIGLPFLSEIDISRHYTRLSRMNYAVDLGIYPLGSCTMKYNPKLGEDIARMNGFINLHPYLPEDAIQGALCLMYELGEKLKRITGMDEISLQPSAGAHGELTGMLIIKAYHKSKGRHPNKVLIPDSAHGTNPASATIVGFEIEETPSDNRGRIDIKEIEKRIDEDVAGVMVTNPNTLGLFEEDMPEIAELLHKVDGLLYYDGANFNAIMGKVNPSQMGCDIVHLNLHKTFATPHGGGGPGSGPICVKKHLRDFLPVPVIDFDGNRYRFNYELKNTIGRVGPFFGNFGVLLKALAYILSMGDEGLSRASEDAVLNANYIRSALNGIYDIPYNYICMHEFVASSRNLTKKYGIKTIDVAKRLIDYGMHPPTIYFPLIVEEALMIEPTETEGLETLDAFILALKSIAKEAEENPDLLHNSPTTTPVGRLDEVRAAKELDIVYKGDIL